MAASLPDPDDLLYDLGVSRRRIAKGKRDYLNEPSSMQVLYGVDPVDYLGAELMMGDIDPEESRRHLPWQPEAVHQSGMFQGLPVSASTAEFYDVFSIYEFESGVFYDRFDGGYGYGDRNVIYHPDDLVNSEEAVPAQITYMPTSSINPSRPRTVAAGYDSERQVITVVFRDGTFYNYYVVKDRNGGGMSPGAAALVWNNFKRARSKGRYILEHLDRLPRGPAEVSHLPPGAREALYRAARTGQILREGYTGKQVKGSKRGKGYGSKTGGAVGPKGGRSLGGGTGRGRNKKKP